MYYQRIKSRYYIINNTNAQPNHPPIPETRRPLDKPVRSRILTPTIHALSPGGRKGDASGQVILISPCAGVTKPGQR